MRHYFRSSLLIFIGCLLTKLSSAQELKTDNLIIEKVKDHVYQHVTYLKTQSFGRVDCNGMIVVDKGEAIIFDTPIDDSTSLAVIDWLQKTLNVKVKAVIATHFHEDCVGGLAAFHKRGIPSYATNTTIDSAKARNFPVPQKGFGQRLELKVGDRTVVAEFNGEGHTTDNIIGYFPSEKVMFGGCLVKELNATKGNLADANVKAWPATIAKIKQKYPDTQIVIPGHGKLGNTSLLDYTMALFEVK